MNAADSTISFTIILFAAIIHASFQMSVSVLTLLSGHVLGSHKAHNRLLHLIGGFIGGVIVMSVLCLSTLAYAFSIYLPHSTPTPVWALGSGAVVGVGISVWLFYYKKGQGTTLWIPRSFARLLSDRSRATKSAVEAFGLGLASTVSELLFTAALFVIAALLLVRLSPDLQPLGILLYSAVSLLPLMVIGLLIGSGRKLSHIQRWREENKQFLQFAAGSGLLILGAYVYVEQVMNVRVVSTIGGF